MHLFYTPNIISSTTHILNEEESRHCVKVLRLIKGNLVYLVDGKGGLYTAEIVEVHPKKTLLNIIKVQKEYEKRNHYLHLAIAPTKHIDRMEWLLEKITEIGVDEITPIICERSERKEIKTDRLNKIITSAVKQSMKAYHPLLNEPVRFKNFINQTPAMQKYIAHCIETPKFTLKEKISLHSNYLILIGPEGDFSPTEVKLASEFGFLPISLGNTRLRTETAALEACFEINFLNR